MSKAIYLGVPAAIVAFTSLAQSAAKVWGRVQTCMVAKMVGVAALFLMVFLNR